jgi:pilus assembly protein CpaD
MTKHSLFVTAFLPALLVGGCSGTVNRSVESVHQPVVTRADYLLDLQVAGSGLAAGERQRLAGWLTGLRVGYGDRVAIDDPTYQATGVREAVTGVVADYGLLLAEQAPVSPAPVAPGTVRVVVSRMTAGVPGCPDHSRDSSVDYNQNTSSNYGCATNVNLAAMVANPQDLIRGAGSVGNDSAASFKAIELYRKAAPTGSGGTTVKSESAGGK